MGTDTVSSDDPPTPVPRVDAPPPAYNSLFGRVQEIQNKSSSPKEFCCNITKETCRSRFSDIIMVVFLIIGLTNIVMGSLFIHSCTYNRMIPIFLVVHGTALAVLLSMFLLEHYMFRKRGVSENEMQGKKPDCVNCFQTLLPMFLFGFFIFGAVTVFGGFNKWSNNSTTADYCHPAVYYYAFGILTAVLGFTALCIVMMCVVSYVSWITGRK